MLKKFIKNIFSIHKDKKRGYLKIKILGFKINKRRVWFDYNLLANELYTMQAVCLTHRETFLPFKNCHNDDCITIIGCGPSLKFYNNEADFVNIALNKAVVLDNINFSYTFTFDRAVLKTCPDYLDRIQKNPNSIHFIGRFLHPEVVLNFPEFKKDKVKNVLRYYAGLRHGLLGLDKSQLIYPDIENHPLVDFYSVSFAALQFALYTYPKKIYLVGLDTYSITNFFDGEPTDGIGYVIPEMLKGYEKFKTFAEMYYPETEIISVNPLGLRGMFKDVYTQSFVDEHPELQGEDIEIIK